MIRFLKQGPALLALVLLFACISCSGKKAGEGTEVKKTEPLVVAMELQFPPFEMTDSDGNPSGISVDMARALGKAMGRPVVIENTAWTGLIPSLQSGKADLIISSMSITEERQKVVDFSIPYAASGLTLLLYRESPVKGAADLDKPGVKVAVKSGTIGAIWAAENLPGENVRIFDEVAACALEVSQGKVDAFIYDALTNFELQKKFSDSLTLNLENLPGTRGLWAVAIKKGRPELKAAVDAFILDYEASGGFENLERKYLGEMKKVFEEVGQPSFLDIQR